MAVARLRVGALGVSRAPVSRWATRAMVPLGVLPEVPETPPLTRLGPESAKETWYLGAAEIALYSGETAHYRDNLQSGAPSLWVALRIGPTPSLAAVTADPYEGEGLVGDPGLLVEAVPMPPRIAAAVAAFFAAHHVERPFKKRKRKRTDLEALGRPAPRGAREGGR